MKLTTLLDLKLFLESHGIKQKYFANKIGVTEMTVSNWLRRKSNPTPLTQKRIDKYISDFFKAPDSFKKAKISINKVYTRSGDGGKTRLIGGQSISKSELRICSYGEIDELNTVIGGCKDQVRKVRHQISDVRSLLYILTIV